MGKNKKEDNNEDLEAFLAEVDLEAINKAAESSKDLLQWELDMEED